MANRLGTTETGDWGIKTNFLFFSLCFRLCSLCLSVSLSVCLSVCLSVSLSLSVSPNSVRRPSPFPVSLSTRFVIHLPPLPPTLPHRPSLCPLSEYDNTRYYSSSYPCVWGYQWSIRLFQFNYLSCCLSLSLNLSLSLSLFHSVSVCLPACLPACLSVFLSLSADIKHVVRTWHSESLRVFVNFAVQFWHRKRDYDLKL